MVKIKILDESGHTEMEMTKKEAMIYIENQIKAGMWVFVDGKFTPNIEDIEENVDVIITQKLLGG